MGAEAPMPIGLDWFQMHVGSWANETFPRSTPHTIARHLFREAVELCLATSPAGTNFGELVGGLEGDLRRGIQRDLDEGGHDDPRAVLAESADVCLLLLHLAHRSGFSLLAVAHTKHEANRAREWGEPDAAGVVEHVRTGARDGG